MPGIVTGMKLFPFYQIVNGDRKNCLYKFIHTITYSVENKEQFHYTFERVKETDFEDVTSFLVLLADLSFPSPSLVIYVRKL